MTSWSVLACDPFTDAERVELLVNDLAPTVELNGPGSLAFTLGADALGARGLLEEANTILYVLRDGNLIGQMPPYMLWSAAPSGMTTKITAAGLDSILDHWYDRLGHSFAWQTDPYTALLQLVTEQQALPDANLGLSMRAIGGLPAGHIGDDEARAGEDNAAYVLNAWDSPSYGDLNRRWSDMDNGYDFCCHAEQQADGSRTRWLDFYTPRRGRHNVALRFSTDTNIIALPEPVRDGTYRAQDVMVAGSGTGKDMIRSRQVAVLGKPLVQATLNKSGLTTTAMADRDARAELTARMASATSLSKITVRDDESNPLGSYFPGDDVYVDAEYGWTSFHGWCRIQAIDYLPGGGANNQDKADVSLARADQFVYGADPNLAVT